MYAGCAIAAMVCTRVLLANRPLNSRERERGGSPQGREYERVRDFGVSLARGHDRYVGLTVDGRNVCHFSAWAWAIAATFIDEPPLRAVVK